MKIAIIGGGSSYTPELINGFLERIETLPLTELWLMDIDSERLEIVGGFAKRMVQAKRAPFVVHMTKDQHQAIREASYVITQLRVGRMAARKEDEYLGNRHGLIGQETTGVGGMAKAMRTIPVVLNIAEDMRELAPTALLINFTNPAGLVTEALSRYAPDIQSVGVCNVPITTKMELMERLERQLGLKVSPEQAELQTLGLNHLSWHYGFTVDGEDVWTQILDGFVEELRQETEPEWDPSTIEALQMIPNYYLQYYYQTDKKIAAQANWPPSRAEAVREIEKGLLKQYAEPDRTEPPEDLMKRGGAYYSTLATQLLNAHYNDLGEAHIVNVPHRGAIPGWPKDWVLEMSCKVSKGGIEPVAADPLPPVCFGLLTQVKMYELLTVEAAVSGSYQAAFQALLTHPLGPSADQVQVVLDDLLETNRDYLPQF